MAFSFKPANSSACPTSPAIATISHLYFSFSHGMIIEVSSPPEYASATRLTLLAIYGFMPPVDFVGWNLRDDYTQYQVQDTSAFNAPTRNNRFTSPVRCVKRSLCPV